MNLTTKINSITLRNPLILASGVLSSSYSILRKMFEAGLGAVVSKSIGPNEREGNPNPTVFFLPEIKSAINSVGLANPGYKIFKEELSILINSKVSTITSIFGASTEEFVEVVKGLDELSFLAYELNLSCPNTEKEGMALGTDPSTVKNIITAVKNTTEKPIWVKLTPNVTDILEIAEAAIGAGCDTLVAINTLKAMAIDIHTATPILGFKRGGLSGAAIKPVGIRAVYDLYEAFGDKIPIVGVGGITTWQDVIEYMLAGATAVEIGTAFGFAYPGNKIKYFLKKIQDYLKEHNYSSISEIIGGAHE